MAIEDNSTLQAGLSTSLVPSKGSGVATYTRTTEATVFDNEGRLITVPSGAARFGGGRFVNNKSQHPKDWITNDNTITLSPGPDGTDTGATFAFTGPTGTNGRLTRYDISDYVDINYTDDVVSVDFVFKYISQKWVAVTIISDGGSGVVRRWIDLEIMSLGSSTTSSGLTLSDSLTPHSAGNGWFVYNMIVSDFPDTTPRTAAIYWSDGNGSITSPSTTGDEFLLAEHQFEVIIEQVSLTDNNLGPHPADWNNTDNTITPADGPDGTDTGATFTFTGQTATSGRLTRYELTGYVNITSTDDVASLDFVFKYISQKWIAVTLLSDGGTGLVRRWIDLESMSLGDSFTNSTFVLLDGITPHTLGDGWHVYNMTISGFPDTAPRGAAIYWSDGNGSVTSPSTTGDEFLLAEHQFLLGEFVLTGNEYVSKGVLSSPFHGGGIDGVKWFDTSKSGVTIPDVELLGYLHEPAATNLTLHARDLTQTEWAETNVSTALSQTGIDNVPNTASLITATGANGTCLQSITLASAARTFSAYIKRDTGTGTVEITRDGGSNWTAVTDDINSLTFTRVAIEGTSVTDPEFGFRLGTSGDAIAVDYCQDESGDHATSPIRTQGTTVTRNADDLSYDIANFSNSEGAIVAKITAADWTDVFGAIGTSTEGLVLSSSNSGVQADDGTNTVNGPTGTPTGQKHLGISWAGTSMVAASDEEVGTSGTYDEDFGISDIGVLAEGNTRDLNVWRTELSTAELIEATGGEEHVVNPFIEQNIALDGSVIKITWENITSEFSRGLYVSVPKFADKTVSIVGTPDGATIVIQGSNDGINWYTLTDPSGDDLSFTSSAMESITENPLYIRPWTNGSGAAQDIDVIILAVLANPLRQ